jgi:hypothetical protein
VKGVAVIVSALLCGSVGCDQLFGAQHVDLDRDAAIDAAPACENAMPFGSECRTLSLTLTNDTHLSPTTPDTPLGGRDAIKIAASEPGLFKFLTTDFAADERIAAMTLTLDPLYSKNAKACSVDNMTCELCPSPAFGAWQLYYLTTSWNEAEATWNTPWSTPGASATPEDRSTLIATGPPTATGDLVMPVSSDALLAHSPDCFRQDGALALLVSIEGAAYFDGHEANQCGIPGKPPALTVTLCR